MAFTLVKYKHLAPSFVEYQEVFLPFHLSGKRMNLFADTDADTAAAWMRAKCPEARSRSPATAFSLLG